MRRGFDAARVLLVEDDDAQADLTASFLEREDDAFSVTTRSAAEPALEYLQDDDVDCVVSDHDMPGKNGLELLDAVRGVEPDLPFVLFTGKGSEEIASEAISAGVTDYLQKEGGSDQYAVLANRVRNAVEKRRSQRALREEKHRLEQVLATTPGSVVFTPDGDVVSATDRARATLGLDGDDAPDPELATIDNRVDEEPEWELTTVDGDPIPDDEHPAARVARSGKPLHGVRLGVVWPDGWRKYLVMHCAPLFDDGEVERVVASFTDITDRVERERTLERTQTVIDAVGDAVYTVDEGGAFTFVNDAFEEMFGMGRGELVGEHASVALDDDHVDAVEDTIQELLRGDRDTSTVQMALGDDAGGVTHIETHVALLPFDGRFRGTVGVVRDVTERVERERKLRESEEKYATVVEEASDAVLIAQDDVLKFANPRAAEILGTAPEDVVGTPVADVVAPEHRDTVVDRLHRRLAGESPTDRYEFEAVDGSGNHVPIEFTAAAIAYESEPAVLAICRDVTERKRRERERRRYATIVRTAPDGVFIIDEDATYVGGNMQGAAFIGSDRDELIGTSVLDLVEDGVFDPEVLPRYEETVSKLLSSDSPDAKDKFEFRAYPSDAEDGRVLECHLALRPHDEEFRGTIGVVRDVTERKRRERELEAQNERLAEFTNVVSHDLRSPLNVATGWLDQYRETGDESALDRVERSHDRMTEILDELLALARNGPDAHNTDDVMLEAVCASAWASVTTEEARLGIDTGGATVEAAESRLQELLENLFSNAVKHGSTSPRSQAHEDAAGTSSGEPSVTDAPEDAVAHAGPEVTVRVGLLDDGDGFYVEDNGAGIPEDEHEEVFEMGHTTAEDGTGFGLAIVEQVADAHGWTVRLTETEPDPESEREWAGGARFEFVTAPEHEESASTTAPR